MLFISERVSYILDVLSLFLFKILFSTFHVPLILVETFIFPWNYVVFRNISKYYSVNSYNCYVYFHYAMLDFS